VTVTEKYSALTRDAVGANGTMSHVDVSPFLVGHAIIKTQASQSQNKLADRLKGSIRKPIQQNLWK
tara:strand:- start:219 stop:416 length:198 start_codon:yes stop_codon:yes gene_type:complete